MRYTSGIEIPSFLGEQTKQVEGFIKGLIGIGIARRAPEYLLGCAKKFKDSIRPDVKITIIQNLKNSIEAQDLPQHIKDEKLQKMMNDIFPSSIETYEENTESKDNVRMLIVNTIMMSEHELVTFLGCASRVYLCPMIGASKELESILMKYKYIIPIDTMKMCANNLCVDIDEKYATEEEREYEKKQLYSRLFAYDKDEMLDDIEIKLVKEK